MKLACIKTGKLKDIRKRRITGYFARIGDLNVSGKTPAEALEILSTRVEQVCTYRMPRYRSIKGFTLIISPCTDARGCHTFLVWPDGHVSESVSPENDYRKIENEERLHIAQVLYGQEQHDADCPPNCKAGLADCYQVMEGTGKEQEFRDWVRFQQDYKRYRAEGKTDVEAHRLACNIPSVNIAG